MEDYGSPGLARLLETLPGSVRQTHAQLGDATAVIERASLRDVMRFLRDEPSVQLDMLSDLTAVDGLDLGWEPRFEVVYHLFSVPRKQRLRIKTAVPEDDPVVDSLVPLWPAANWLEREVWDLYGIRFADHPDLRRILLYDQFEGHPLRKDYPKERRQPLVGPRN